MTDRACTYLDPYGSERCTECGTTVDLCLCVNINDSAHERLASPDGILATMIRGELRAARAQFPGTTHMLAALMEEVGELAQAMMEHDRDGSQTVPMVMREAVQVAAMAIRIATEGDENFAYQFPRQEEELPSGPVGRQYE